MTETDFVDPSPELVERLAEWNNERAFVTGQSVEQGHVDSANVLRTLLLQRDAAVLRAEYWKQKCSRLGASND